MRKKITGICCICGKETKLTFEHIPPKAAFNSLGLRLYDLYGYMIKNSKRYESFQSGAGKYSLCASCNNLTGEWYGNAYAEFALQGKRYHYKDVKGVLSVPYEIYPLRVFKQVVSCFASVNGSFWCERHPQIRQFLLDPSERRFPDRIDIRMYMQTNNQSKMGQIIGIYDVKTRERFVGSEWAYPPFSFICVEDKTYTRHNALNDLYSINPFLSYDYNTKVKLYLHIPCRPCNPTTLDFRKNVPDLKSFIEMEDDCDEDSEPAK